jgi:hypothetical protein
MDSGDGDDPVAYCWGCSTLILVPCLEGKPAELFKVRLDHIIHGSNGPSTAWEHIGTTWPFKRNRLALPRLDGIYTL